MRKHFTGQLTQASAAMAILLLPAFGQASDWNWKFEDHEPVKQSFSVGAGSPRKLLVDNVSGFIHVTGTSGGSVQITVDRHTRAQSNEAMAEARRDVKLDMSQQGNFVRLYADGPFRGSNGTNYRGDDYYGYRVEFNIEIQAPADMEVVLKTINGGVELKKTTGDYDIHGLNGGIDMEDVSGSGVVNTLNGSVKVSYSRNPERATSFKTLNGKVDVYFQPGLNADMHFKTFNGSVYTDFDLSSLPVQPAQAENNGGKFIYRSNREMAGRVGRGGPELMFDAFNGSIRLHSKAI